MLSSVVVKANFDFNNNCAKAYQCLWGFKLTEARELIDKEKLVHPKNVITSLLDNYYDFFYLLTTENRADFERLIENKSARIDRIEADDENSPYQKFAIAQINLQWALLHTRFADYTSAGFEINRAYRLLQSNQKAYPAFLPNAIPLGMVNVLLGSLPAGPLKTILGILGIHGNTQVGCNLLQSLTTKLHGNGYDVYYTELIFYLTYIQTDVIGDSDAYAKMRSYIDHTDSTGLLKSYIAGYVCLRTGHSAEAIEWLENRPTGNNIRPYPFLDYLLAIAKFNLGEADAKTYFEKFLLEYKGANYIKDSYLHLAWIALLSNDSKQYNANITLVKTKGNLFVDKDRQAFDEANDRPGNITLLKARFLFDGGLYKQALSLLSTKKETDFTPNRDRLEFVYRLARITEAMGKDDDALSYYKQIIAIGSNSAYHYAATSALRMGGIYERHKETSNASWAYKMIPGFKNTQFRNSLQQKATDRLEALDNLK